MSDEEKGKVTNFKPRDEFSAFEEDFKDPEIEAELEALRNNRGFVEMFKDKVMTDIQNDERFSARRVPANVIGNERLRQVTMQNNRGEATEQLGKIIQFKQPARKP